MLSDADELCYFNFTKLSISIQAYDFSSVTVYIMYNVYNIFRTTSLCQHMILCLFGIFTSAFCYFNHVYIIREHGRLLLCTGLM